MFDELSDKFEEAIKSLRGQDKLTASNIEGALKIVRKALIDADVNLDVTDEFLKEIKQEALGAEVVKGIKPAEKFIEVVHKKLIDVLGDKENKIEESQIKPTIVLLVGLQGAGKTTAAAKLGLYLKSNNKKVLLVGADTFRPAAKDQLRTLADQNSISFFTGDQDMSSLAIAKAGIEQGAAQDVDTIIIDTAGRLYIDNDLMNELSAIKNQIKPDEVLLVVDSMIGQEAAILTKEFNEKVGITGGILTKMDGDSRGGAALSIKKVSGKSIKFIGTGEKVEALEPYYPDRMASRILGMGDILTLVDKAQKEVEIEDVLTMQKKFEEASFDYEDFLKQMQLMKRMGSIGGLLRMIPGMKKLDNETLRTGEDKLRRIEVIIASMSNHERKRPEELSQSVSRRKRIAKGSGTSLSEVEKVISDFEKMKMMMQGLAKGQMGSMWDNSKGKMPIEGTDKQMRTKVFKKKKGFADL